ncbi:MAG: alkaline shock response membrane anchor protein AmaP [Candidatus Omnitrophota bacterium]
MRFLYNLGIYFYVSVLTVLGLLLVALPLQLIRPNDIIAALDFVYGMENSGIILVLAGVLLIILAFSFAQVLMGKMQKEKTIAFNNPSGQVTIALSAVEDLIKRLTAEMAEIKEARSDVIAGKKGLEVDLRITLRSEANIPELTNSLQEGIKGKIQEILGLEEEITVKVHVGKIIAQEAARDKQAKEEGGAASAPSIPFQGYGS